MSNVTDEDVMRELIESQRAEIERLTALTATQAEDIGQQTRREEGLRTEVERLRADLRRCLSRNLQLKHPKNNSSLLYWFGSALRTISPLR